MMDMKEMGIKNRCRVYEIPDNINDLDKKPINDIKERLK